MKRGGEDSNSSHDDLVIGSMTMRVIKGVWADILSDISDPACEIRGN